MPTTKKPATVDAYLKSLPADRREAIEAIRAAVLKALPKGYEEGMQYGMIGYAVPHSLYPPGYHCDPQQPLPFMSIGNQKGHIGLYMFCLYTDPSAVEAFAASWKATGKRLDMGKSCVRVKKLEDVPLDVLAKTIKAITVKKFVASYEAQLESNGTRHPGKASANKAPSKKVTKKKVAKKKTAGKKR
ncbi:MAG: DUF1801 domain-containing protein [Phycisphaerales bacterium]